MQKKSLKKKSVPKFRQWIKQRGVWGCGGVCVRARTLSCIWLFVTSWTVAHQALLSMRFSRQEYWSGVPCLLPTPLHSQCVCASLCSTPGTVSVVLVLDFTKSKQTGWTVFGEAKPSVTLIHSWIYSCSKYSWADHSVPGSVLGTKGKIDKQSKFEKSLLFRELTLLLRDITNKYRKYIFIGE